MAVRGAPAIGVSAAFGIALGARRSPAEGAALRRDFEDVCEQMRVTRPTAVNLFWAIERMRRRFAQEEPRGGAAVREGLLAEAQAILEEDLASCHRMGDLGAALITRPSRILTPCNAGALAPAGYGTALGVIRSAAPDGGAPRGRGGASRRPGDGPRGRVRAQPRLRRASAPLRHRHRLREGRGPRPLCLQPARAGGGLSLRLLAIETSCDETAAAVVEDGRRILSNVVSTQAAVHAAYGGVVPEVAARHHLENICPVIEKAMAEARMTFPELDAVAVTQGPGLVGALLVGVQVAKGIAFRHAKPLVPVHHIAGHLEAPALALGADVPLPALALVVSGGHTSLFEMAARGEYHLLGRTRDDAAGEAFAKGAKLLRLGHPGGPRIGPPSAGADDPAPAVPLARMNA